MEHQERIEKVEAMRQELLASYKQAGMQEWELEQRAVYFGAGICSQLPLPRDQSRAMGAAEILFGTAMMWLLLDNGMVKATTNKPGQWIHIDGAGGVNIE